MLVETLDTPIEIKYQKSLLIPCVLKGYSRSKSKFSDFLKFFLQTVSSIENIVQIRIVDHKIIYKNVPHSLFPKNHHP